jgi:beta-mannosidase
MPQNMGALYWQVNDCWTVASWSGMDYYGRWKAMQYYARRFFEPLLVSPHISGDKIEIYVVSDFPEAKNAELKITLMDLSGKELMSRIEQISVEPIKGKVYLKMPVKEIAGGRDESDLVLVAELKSDGKIVSTNQHYFKPFKDLKIRQPKIETKISKSGTGFKVSLSSDVIAKSVYLDGFNEGRFSDNYFDLIPGKAVEIEFMEGGNMGESDFRRKLRVRSLIDAF